MKKRTWLKDEWIKDKLNIYHDFLSLLKEQSGWKGEIKENDTDKSITIVCGSIMSLEEFLASKSHAVLEYEEVEQLILDIGLQSMVLGTYNKGIFFLNLEDILVIDRRFFLLRDLSHVLDIKKQDTLFLSYPMKIEKSDDRFIAPELKMINKVLPFYSPVTVGYYSLAKICVVCLGLLDDLGPIKGSKMYFFLERCLAEERYFLYV
jgi:hypothetical protein